jgi:hypothetical protein
MKTIINIILTATFLAASGSVALADGHYTGQGFSSIVSSTTIEEKSGSIVGMIAEDFWQYQNASEGWPTAAMATCHFTMLMAAGKQAPSSINGICESADPVGDASVWVAAIDPSTGIGNGNLTSGTGEYKGVKALPTFQTTFQIDATHSIYDFKW